MTIIELKRGYEVLPDNNVRFGIRLINTSDSAILDVEVILDYNESLFMLEGSKIQKLGTIPPAVTRTAKFVLKPRGCIHKEEIGATIRYKDHQWQRHTLEMRAKEVHCVCPFLKEKSITRADFLSLSNTGYLEEQGVNFEGITIAKLVEFLLHTCKNRLYKVDEFSIESGTILYLAGDALGEKAYYLLTAVVKEYDGVTQVLLRAASDKKHGINGFLNEILDNLRHLVSSTSAREIGVIKKEQVINIIDSVVQRTTFAAGEGVASVNIEGSVVQRAELKVDAEKKKRLEEEERLRKEKEEQERLRKEEEEQKAEQEKERQKRLQMDKEERKRLRREEEEREARERKAREDAEKRKREEQKARQEKERLKREEEEQGRLRKAKEKQERLRREESEKNAREELKTPESGRGTSQKRFLAVILAVILVPSAIVLGYWVFAPDSTDAPITPTVSQTPRSAADFTNTIGMEFMQIPAGEFEMGSPSDEEDRRSDEGPVHLVNIEKPFYMGKYEVTQKQWRDVMGDNPSHFKGDDLPVVQVSWDDVQEFIKKLNAKEGTNKYRLPSEAEWEYACRAGTTTRYSFGDDESKLGEYAWYEDNSGGKTHPVGRKLPNPWGLYDMHGNVWEWTQDKWHDNYNGAPADGSAWESGDGSYRVDRGGGWTVTAGGCRSAFRDRCVPSFLFRILGFRLLKEK